MGFSKQVAYQLLTSDIVHIDFVQAYSEL